MTEFLVVLELFCTLFMVVIPRPHAGIKIHRIQQKILKLIFSVYKLTF